MRLERINEMEQYISQNKTVTLDRLCEVFGVSKNTVRRDIHVLVARGTVSKTYGGVSAIPQKGLSPFLERAECNPGAKRRIGDRAADFVEDGDVIFIDSGTTTRYMFDRLKQKQDVTILTNNLDIIYQAIDCPNLTIISLSGVLNRETLSFTGQTAADVLESFNINKAFMASTGISIRNGATNAFAQECAIKQAAIRRCRQAILLVDHSKFDVAALLSYCSLEQIHLLVCDAPPPKAYFDYFAAHNNRIVIAG
jgi:DeoR family myo-inositol catabolism operon transcriptional repressor